MYEGRGKKKEKERKSSAEGVSSVVSGTRQMREEGHFFHFLQLCHDLNISALIFTNR